MNRSDETRFTDDGSPRLAYRVDGRRGPWVLLIMGAGMRGSVWRPQIEGLAGEHRVISFDNRGIGDSEDPAGRYRMGDLGRDALRVLDAVGEPSAHVVGVSLGGMIAQETALAAPERIRSLTLIATHAGGPRGLVPFVPGIARAFLKGLSRSSPRYAAAAHLLYPPSFLATMDHADLDRRMHEQFERPATRSARLKQFYAIAWHDTAARLRELDVPTLVIRTGVDNLVRSSNQSRLTAALKAAEVVTFENAGHGVIYQYRDALNRRLARHFARHDRDRHLVIDTHP